jgi:hypothetical protein
MGGASARTQGASDSSAIWATEDAAIVPHSAARRLKASFDESFLNTGFDRTLLDELGEA